MGRLLLAILAAFFLTSCERIDASNIRTERTIAASCQIWENKARKAAHPDDEMIARHDRLMATSAKLLAESKSDDDIKRRAAIEKAVQAEADAEAIYDWREALEIASRCWEELATVEEDHRAYLQRMSSLRQELQSAPPSIRVTLPSTTLPTAIVAQPLDIEAPSSRGNQSPPHVQTWGETSCAPMIPPVMRDQPITNVNPMVPPGCR